MKQLSPQQIDLLERLVRSRAPVLRSLLIRLKAHPYPAVTLSDSEAEALSQIVIDEFSEKGLNPDDEPNEYGIQLDHLASSILLREHDTPSVSLNSARKE